jgi:predicted amidophosphoribosyltransferase
VLGADASSGEGSREEPGPGKSLLNGAIEYSGSTRWPFHLDPSYVEKRQETQSLVGKRVVERRAIAETELRSALQIPDPNEVSGRRFLVFGDVFTDGSTLREIARALRGAEALQVGGIVLACQPWRS